MGSRVRLYVSGRTESYGSVAASALAMTRESGTQRILLSMKFYSFEIVIEKEPEDEGYMSYCPGLPGCFSDGLSIEEARANIREAIEQHLSFLIEQGVDIPQNDSIVYVEELSVGIPS